MKIPDKYKEIHKKAQEIDAKIEFEKMKSTIPGKIRLIALRLVTRNVDRIINLENEITELNIKIETKKNEIETAKQNLKEYGIIIPDTDL